MINPEREIKIYKGPSTEQLGDPSMPNLSEWGLDPDTISPTQPIPTMDAWSGNYDVIKAERGNHRASDELSSVMGGFAVNSAHHADKPVASSGPKHRAED